MLTSTSALPRQLPYLVGNVVELLDMAPTVEEAEDGANVDLDAVRKGKSRPLPGKQYSSHL